MIIIIWRLPSPFEKLRSFPPLIARYKNNNEQFYVFITGLSARTDSLTNLKLSQKAPSRELISCQSPRTPLWRRTLGRHSVQVLSRVVRIPSRLIVSLHDFTSCHQARGDDPRWRRRNRKCHTLARGDWNC